MCLGDLIKTFGQEYTSSNEAGGGDLEIGSGCIFRFALYFFSISPRRKNVRCFWKGGGGERDPLKEQLSNSSALLLCCVFFFSPPLCLISKPQLFRRGTETLAHSLHQAAGPGAGEGIPL